MPSTDEVVKRLHESKPPATDAATYLTIIEMSLSPEILPTLEEILDDAAVTDEIGWDLVEMLITVPGCEGCLERVARLGNPREVILKVLEVMEKAITASERQEEETSEPLKNVQSHQQAISQFGTLCNMLSVLHTRLKVKSPSRFLQTTLDTVYRTYDPSSVEATQAVVALVRSLSGQTRPPLPSRQSSTLLATSSNVTGENAPDPEAKQGEKPNSNEPRIMDRLLGAFVTCIIEAYVNSNSMEWASRLLEYTFPEKIVPKRQTMMQSFNQIHDLQARDELVGQLVALAGDLGLTKASATQVKEILEGPIIKEPLLDDFDPDSPQSIKLSTGGFVCLIAYWMFSTDVFDARHTAPDLYVFPDGHKLLQHYLEDDVQNQVSNNPGTIEALTVISLWLHTQSRIVRQPTEPGSESDVDFMSYHHLLTLVSVFHANIRVRNAATVLAGMTLQEAPEETRLAILEDLLENCMFSSLKACAVAWLKDEIIATKKAGLDQTSSRFNDPDCFETLQYTLFPDLTYLKESDPDILLDFWAEGAPFHLQVANFALFLLSGDDYRGLAPAGMAAAIEHRYVEPLQHTIKILKSVLDKKEVAIEGPETDKQMYMQLDVLSDTLSRVPLQ